MKFPELGEVMAPAHPSDASLEMLWRRRSTPADFLGDPGPDAETVEAMLTIAARAPDHRRVTPFRFVLFEGEARERFGKVLEAAFVANEPDAEEKRIAIERNRFMRAPLVVAVVSSVNRAHRTPEWEQILSAGAVCQNLLLAASAHGFAAQWLTEWYAFDEKVLSALSLEDHERIAGYVYVGTARENPKERARPDVAAITSRY